VDTRKTKYSLILHVPVRKLSLGQRMKCELIATLLHNPKVVFLDEPTIGLDVVMQQNVREFIREYNRKYNATILLTSHYMKDVQQLCKRVIFIDHGKILFDGKLEEIIKQFGGEKILKMTMKEKVEKKELAGLGNILSYEYPQIILSVPMSQSNKTAATLLEKFPIEDLTIEEADIEEVIREMFMKRSLSGH
jgi:ABC-2 type transport system ATP-binding protein